MDDLKQAIIINSLITKLGASNSRNAQVAEETVDKREFSGST